MGRVVLDVEEAFAVEVDLLAETCCGCGFSLAMSTDWIGGIAENEAGLPVARLWHEQCAPAVLRAAHAEAQGDGG